MQDKSANRGRAAGFPAGFTLVELMTVLAILAILMSILIPVIGKVRQRAQIAVVQQQLNEIEGAIARFYQDQGSYPGPLPNSALYTAGRANGATALNIYDASTGAVMLHADKITQEENLVLGLLGGLKFQVVGGSSTLFFDRAMVGRGMINLAGKKFDPYMSVDPTALSPAPSPSIGQYSDGTGGVADDSPIPEFLDKFSSPMPILYMRAHVGATGVVRSDVPEVTTDPARQYCLSDIYPYTRGSTATTSIGEGKRISANDYHNAAVMPNPAVGFFPHGLQTVDTTKSLDKSNPNYTYPYDLFPYLLSPTVQPTNPADLNGTGTARSAGTYILISAGPDRVYGTADDICSFGSVTP